MQNILIFGPLSLSSVQRLPCFFCFCGIPSAPDITCTCPPRVAQWRGLPLPGSPLLTVTPDAPRCRRSIFYCLAPWSGLPCRPSAGPRRHSTVLSSADLRRPRRRRSVSARARRRCICLSPRTADLCSRCVKPLRLVLSEGMRVSGPLSGRRVPPLSN